MNYYVITDSEADTLTCYVYKQHEAITNGYWLTCSFYTDQEGEPYFFDNFADKVIYLSSQNVRLSFFYIGLLQLNRKFSTVS